MPGDAAFVKAEFTSKNSTITTNKGDSFYVTNTTAVINLENNKIINNDSTGNFLRIQKDSWGNSGSNGGNVTMSLINNSSHKGTINNANIGEVNLTLDKTSSITLTGDTYIKSLTNDDTENSNINLNGYKLYVNGVELKK